MPHDRYLAREGARIAWELTDGQGPVVAYAHGVLLSRAMVRAMGVFDIDAVAAGRRLLTYDQRGHGHSTGRSVTAAHTFDGAADDLLAVLDAAGVDRPVDFVGSSLGAAAVLVAALRAPERFRRLALVIPPAAWEHADPDARRWYLDAADEIDTHGGGAWRRHWAATTPDPRPRADRDLPLTPDIADESMSIALRAVGESDLPDPARIAALPHPTLILTWAGDPLHPVATAERLHALLTGSALHVARTPAEVATWTGQVTDFFTR